MTGKSRKTLKVKTRGILGKASSRRARRQGFIPAVIYGHGAVPRHVLMDSREWDAISGKDIQIVDLKPEDGDDLTVLIKEEQYDYLSGMTKHLDFLEVKMDEVITAFVTVHTHGMPVGLSQGGILDVQLHEIEVECTPATLPDSIDIDVSGLNLDDAVLLGEVALPDGVKALGEPDHVVLHVILPRIEKEPEPAEVAAEGVEAAEPELVGGEKKEEAEEEASK
ncbi:MAG: 50S ribosomal protein L25 [Victivallales bacterium]|nr:50S ribosomal protein L25 [Victivallales bacterium]